MAYSGPGGACMKVSPEEVHTVSCKINCSEKYAVIISIHTQPSYMGPLVSTLKHSALMTAVGDLKKRVGSEKPM